MHGGLTRPLHSLRSRKNPATVPPNIPKSRHTGVALPNRIRSDETKRSTISHKRERSTKKVGDQIDGLSTSALVELSEQIAVGTSESGPHTPSGKKRRISHDRIKTTVLPREYLRKLDLPMKSRQQVRALLQGRDKSGELVPRHRRSAEPALDLGAFLLACLWLVLGEERRDQRQRQQQPCLRAVRDVAIDQPRRIESVSAPEKPRAMCSTPRHPFAMLARPASARRAAMT